MNLLQRRKDTSEALFKNRFIRQILNEESKEISLAQSKLLASRGFTGSNLHSDRHFSVTDTAMKYEHLKKHRFVDMRRRQGQKKKHHPVHNRILYGHANTIIKRLHFGFTIATKDILRNEP